MRGVVAISTAALLAGCVSYERTDPPYPRQQASPRSTSNDTPVDRWTKQQRECEAGNRDKQRRCMMRFPEE